MNSDQIIDIATVRILDCAPGPIIEREQHARDLVGLALTGNAEWAMVPVSRLSPNFFRLKTGLAGEVVQKFANYEIGLAVIGDIEGQLAESDTLREFVREANRGQQLWFLPDRKSFERKLGR